MVADYMMSSKCLYIYVFEGDCIQNFIFGKYKNCRLLWIGLTYVNASTIYFGDADKLRHLFAEKGVWRDNRLVFYDWGVNLTFVREYDDLDPKLPQNVQLPLLKHAPRVLPVTIMPPRESKKRTQTLIYRGKITNVAQFTQIKPFNTIRLQYDASRQYYNDGLQLGFNFANKGENIREYRVYYDAERDLTFAQIRFNRILAYAGDVNDFDNIPPSQTFDTSREASRALYGGNTPTVSILLTRTFNKKDNFDYVYDDFINMTLARYSRINEVEPAKVEPAKVEPAKVEPAKVEPAKVEPVKVEPVKVEPVKVEPAFNTDDFNLFFDSANKKEHTILVYAGDMSEINTKHPIKTFENQRAASICYIGSADALCDRFKLKSITVAGYDILYHKKLNLLFVRSHITKCDHTNTRIAASRQTLVYTGAITDNANVTPLHTYDTSTSASLTYFATKKTLTNYFTRDGKIKGDDVYYYSKVNNVTFVKSLNK
jgi:hypothetical protein